jgi:hypothetical protein
MHAFFSRWAWWQRGLAAVFAALGAIVVQVLYRPVDVLVIVVCKALVWSKLWPTAGTRAIACYGGASVPQALPWFERLLSQGRMVAVMLFALGAALATYHVLTLRARPRDGVTRCGHCGYALRGLSEPRCPECGQTV